MSAGRGTKHRRNSAKRLVLGLSVGLITGISAGLGSAAFLHALTWATETRVDRPRLLWLLPVAGLGIGLLRRAAGRATAGTNLLLDEFHTEETDHDLLPDDAAPDGRVPFHLAPYVLLGSVTTHLFGGSGGREGAAVQIAAGLAAPSRPALERAAGRSGISALHVRRLLVVTALAGGFGSVFGVPFAGTVFGTEALRRWRPRTSEHLRTRIDEAVAFLPAAAVASFVGHIVTKRLGIHHTKPPTLDSSISLGVVVVAVASGLLARAFLAAHHGTHEALVRSRLPVVAWPMVGGALVVVITLLVGTRAYLGLSLPLIDAALIGATLPAGAFAFKLLFTAVTLGSGFPGGEVTPLLCMGACLGTALAGPLGGSAPLLAAVGMVATWAAASNTPISAAVMGAELFGPLGLLVFVPMNVAATFISGTKGVYRAQR